MFTKNQFTPLSLSGSILMIIASIAIIIAVIMALTQSNRSYGMNTITVTGTGEVMAVPDIARLSFSVMSESTDVAEAQENIIERMDAIFDAINEYVKEEDMRTTGYTVQPRYDWVDGIRQERGFEVRQSINLIIRDVDNVGVILGLLGSLQVSNLNGPYFEIDDEQVFAREAHSKALEDARLQAEEMADTLGVRLKRVVSVYEGYKGYSMPYASDMRAEVAMLSDGAPTPTIPAGENTIIKSVDVTYRIR